MFSCSLSWNFPQYFVAVWKDNYIRRRCFIIQALNPFNPQVLQNLRLSSIPTFSNHLRQLFTSTLWSMLPVSNKLSILRFLPHSLPYRNFTHLCNCEEPIRFFGVLLPASMDVELTTKEFQHSWRFLFPTRQPSVVLVLAPKNRKLVRGENLDKVSFVISGFFVANTLQAIWNSPNFCNLPAGLPVDWVMPALDNVWSSKPVSSTVFLLFLFAFFLYFPNY